MRVDAAPSGLVMTDSILDALTIKIAVLNRDGIIIEANSAWLRDAAARSGGRLLGIGTDYRAGWDDDDGLFAVGAYDILAGIEQVLRGERKRFTFEYAMRVSDEKRWVRLEAAALKDGDIVLAHTDLTSDAISERIARLGAQNQHLRDRLRRRKRLPAGPRQSMRLLLERSTQLTRLNTELQEFTSVVSHELREPLRMVASFIHLLQRRYGGQFDQQANEYIHYAADGAQRMQALIDALMDYARVDHGARKPQAVDCDDALARAIAILQETIAANQAHITYDPMPTVLGNDVEISLVFRNLISNAIKFHGAAPPRIHIGARREGTEWRFSVRDHGIGVDLNDADRIFDIFVRAQNRRDHPGSGIGLAICRKVITRHGGRIWVENPADGGARFCFTLPAPHDNA